jgi:predicted acyltransferase
MTPDGNSAAYVDRLLLTPLFGPSRFADMKIVLLPTIGAVATTMIGLLAGQWLRGAANSPSRIRGLAAAGILMVLLGIAWGSILPINKQLWTGSYVFLMTGIAALSLVAIGWITRWKNCRSWSAPLAIAGINALLFYVLAQGLQRLLVYSRIRAADGSTVRLRSFIYEQFFEPWISGQAGALAYSLTFLALCYSVVYVLYRRGIVLRA